MHDHPTHRARRAAHHHDVNRGLPTYGVRGCQYPLRCDQHAVALDGQVGEGAKLGFGHSVAQIGHVVANDDRTGS
jgi:hypothetical protein